MIRITALEADGRGVEGAVGDLPFAVSGIPAVNVASVPQRSPLRYPGGKTWLIPHVREWLLRTGARHPLLVEPFVGGGIVSLTAVMEGLASRALMVDLDRDVAAFWRAALDDGGGLIERVLRFDLTLERIQALLRQAPRNAAEHGFQTLVLNRTRRGGVLAPGASLTKHGENGNGPASRWYPDTLAKRISVIASHADQFTFIEGDGLRVLEDIAVYRKDACFFIDPPYTMDGGKRAGSRLYAHNKVDHANLFKVLADSGVNFMMTYDCCDEVASLVQTHGFHAAAVLMKNGHHARIAELVITRERLFT